MARWWTGGDASVTVGGMTDDEIWKRMCAVWETGAREISRLPVTVDRQAILHCVQTIATCKGKIITMGCGTSAAAARKVAHTLSCVERPSFFLSPSDAPHGALGAVQPDDVVILISKGGGTRELVDLIPSLKAKRVTLVTATENPSSPLAMASHLVIQIAVEKEADPFNMLATTSTMAVVTVFDAICIALMDYMGYTREQFAVIHPHGAVGDRLTGKK